MAAGFTDLDNKSLLRQSLTRTELDHDFVEPSVGVFTVNRETDTGESRRIGFATYHHTPQTVTWANQTELVRAFDTQIARDAFGYIGEIVIDPAERGLQAGAALLSGLGEYGVARNGGLEDFFVGFDFASPNAGLPRMVSGVCGPSLGLGAAILARQGQFAFAPAEIVTKLGSIEAPRPPEDGYPTPLLGDTGPVTVASVSATDLLVDPELLSPRLGALVGDRPVYMLKGIGQMGLKAAVGLVTDLPHVDSAVLIIDAPLDYSTSIRNVAHTLQSEGFGHQLGLVDVQTFAAVINARV